MNYQQSLKSLFKFLSCSLLLVVWACQSGPEGPDGTQTVSFIVTNYRQVSFDDLTAESNTRATESIVMDLANLSVSIFNAQSNELVVPTILHRSSDYDSDGTTAKQFPKFSVSQPYGQYRILVLGYNGSRACSITSLNHIAWEENYVPNTFLYSEVFTLDENSSLTREITLRHVVAAFRVTAEDVIPTGLKKMRFSSSVGGTVLDGSTGFAMQNTGRTSDIAVPTSYVGKEGVDFTVYLFLSGEQDSGSYAVQALGENDVVLKEKHFPEVPLRINYLTQWQGKFFEASSGDTSSVQSGFNIKWNMDWAGTIPLF